MIPTTIRGRLGGPVEIRYTKSDKPVANLRIAVPQRQKDPDTGEWRDAEPIWITAVSWDDADALGRSGLDKGSEIVVEGTLVERTWTKRDGTEQRRFEIKARTVAAVISPRQGVVITPPITRAASTPNADAWDTEPAF